MEGQTHERLVAGQFGPAATAYVTSAVHAGGEDLEQIAALVRGRGAARALDLGCGGGHVTYAVAPHVTQVVAYDLSPDMLRVVAEQAAGRGLANVETRQGTVERLPFADAAFDFVLSRFSAHHWHGFAAALAEARRVLKPAGVALFLDAVSPGPALLDTFLQAFELLRDPSHVRDYSVAEWIRAVTEAGFLVRGVTLRRLRIPFQPWIERMQASPLQAEAVRFLQTRMSADIVRHFAIEADGTFTLDTMALEAGALEAGALEAGALEA